MFNNMREFFNWLDVNPIWPTIVLAVSIIDCLIPDKPIGKIKKSKDKENNTVYTVFKNKN